MPHELTARDATLLRHAIDLAAQSVARDARPFGAIVARADGTIIAQANAVPTTDIRDWTAHSEMSALRDASSKLSWAELAECTLYASGEPCPMCAAAVYWCNIRRVVFGASEPAIRDLRRRFTRAAGIELSCRAVLSHAPADIDIIGPCLEDEAMAPHQAFWPHAADEA